MDVTTNLNWKGLDDPTVEHCTIIRSTGNIVVKSKIEGLVNNVHTIAEYELQLTTSWIVYSVDLNINNDNTKQSVKLMHNKAGEWTDASMRVVHELDGCIDIDISLTPFTNTLPVKRLCFKTGESRELKMLYIDLHSFDVKAQPQRYTYLGNNHFVFEALDTGYKNEITFTPDGFVRNYPGLFELTS
jgi:hypothetical protein